MNPPAKPTGPSKTRFASAAGPVNRRTATPEPLPPLPPTRLNRSVRQKIAQGHAEQLLGSPLSQQLMGRRAVKTTSTATIALALGFTLSGAGVLIAWLQASPMLAGIAAAVGLTTAGATWFLRSRKGSTNAAMGDGMIASAFDPQALAALDAMLHQLAPKVPVATLAQLRELKNTLARIAPLLVRNTVNEHFTQEDRFYLTELVRRYLPDTLSAYLQVPAIQREVPAADGKTALTLLAEQLTSLQTQLSLREAKLVQVANEALLQQHRFLQAKHTDGG